MNPNLTGPKPGLCIARAQRIAVRRSAPLSHCQMGPDRDISITSSRRRTRLQPPARDNPARIRTNLCFDSRFKRAPRSYPTSPIYTPRSPPSIFQTLARVLPPGCRIFAAIVVADFLERRQGEPSPACEKYSIVLPLQLRASLISLGISSAAHHREHAPPDLTAVENSGELFRPVRDVSSLPDPATTFASSFCTPWYTPDRPVPFPVFFRWSSGENLQGSCRAVVNFFVKIFCA